MTEWILHDWIKNQDQLEHVQRIEFDVLEYDGKVLLAHDQEKITSDTLELHQALPLLLDTGLPLMCDLKSYSNNFLRKVASAFQEAHWKDQIIFSSHLAQDSRWIARQIPGAKCSWSIPQVDLSGVQIPVPCSTSVLDWWKANIHHRVADMLRFNACDILSTQFELATPELTQTVHRYNKQVYAWTVDGKDRADQLVELGVDGIISNNPSQLQ